MGLAIFILLIICAIVFPKSRTVSFLILAFMWIVYGLNTYSGDYMNYLKHYEVSHVKFDRSLEIGYSALMYVFAYIGASFTAFKVALASVCIPLLWLIVKKYTDYTAFALAMIMLFPFLHFVSILRAGVASLLVLFGLRYLEEESKRGVIKYALWVIGAMTFHRCAAIFFLLIFARKKIELKMEIAFVATGVVLDLILYNTMWIYNIVELLSDNPKVLGWFHPEKTDHPNLTGAIALLFIIGIMIILERVAKREHIRNLATGAELIRAQEKRFVLMDNIANLLLLVVPLALFSSVFLRVCYMAFPVVLCFATNAFVGDRKIGARQVAYRAFIICITAGIFLYTQLPYIGTDIMAINLLFNNLLL